MTPYYCAECLTELGMPSEEWDCPQCNKEIAMVSDYLTTVQLEQRRALMRAEWDGACRDGLIKQVNP